MSLWYVPVPCLMSCQVVFSKPVDIIIASLPFGSLFYHLSHVLLEPGMHEYCEESLAHSLLKITVLAGSLLEQSEFFLHALASAE